MRSPRGTCGPRPLHGTTLALLGVGVAVLLLLGAAPAHAAGALTIQPITWGVVGLDANDVASGPDRFPVGAVVCNGGTTAAEGVTTTFAWDSESPYLAIAEPATSSQGTLEAGACVDVLYTVVIARDPAAFGAARGFHLTVSAPGLAPASTPVPREARVERLVSQSRNGVDAIEGPTELEVGQVGRYTVTSSTAPQGYPQLQAATLFPSSMFRVRSVTSEYSAPGGTVVHGVYADGCGWDADPSSPGYLSCAGPEGIEGGKAGGKRIRTTYEVEAIAPGVTALQTLIHDMSGSSFHYNSDYATETTQVTVRANRPPLAVDDSASTRPGRNLRLDVLLNDSDPDGDRLRVVSASQPSHGEVECDPDGRCEYEPDEGFTGTDAFTYTISDGRGGTATARVAITVATTVPALGVDSPVPVALAVVGLAAGLLLARRRKAGVC